MGVIVVGGAGAGACRRTSLLPRSDGAAVVVAASAPAGDQGVAFAPEIEPNDTLAAAQKLAFDAALTPIGITGRLEAAAGKSHDVDLFRLTIAPAPGTDAPAPTDALPALLRRRLSVTVEPESTVAVLVDALDDQGQTLIAAAGAAPGEADGFPNLAV
ncbi:MAG TPA: hypothetical protein VGL59_05655, partial [Polyangia bacterium]